MKGAIPNSNTSPRLVSSGLLTALIQKRVEVTDFDTDAQALDCLYISYASEVEPGGTPARRPTAGTITVDGDGAGTQIRITLTVENQNAAGAAAADISFTIDGDGSVRSDWSSGAAVANTLKDIIDLINEDDAGGTFGKMLSGFKAWIGPGGMYDMLVTGASFFQDLSETYIQPPGNTLAYTSFLKRDMAVFTYDSDYMFYWRISSVQELRDRANMYWLDLWGTVGTDAGATVKAYRDDYDEFVEPVGTWATDIANHPELFSVATSALATTPGVSLGLPWTMDKASVIRGPIVIILKGDTGSGQTLNLAATIRSSNA